MTAAAAAAVQTGLERVPAADSAGRVAGSRPPSGKLPALQHPQLQQQPPALPQQPQQVAKRAVQFGSKAQNMGGGNKQQPMLQAPLPRHQHQPRRDPYTDPEVTQRTAAWAKLMDGMQQSTEDGAQFVYLRHAWPQQLPFNPFDLEVGDIPASWRDLATVGCSEAPGARCSAASSCRWGFHLWPATTHAS